ncbi:MAG TPA: DUF2442 domain-containing protein [Phycisphaerae bacterium]|nr:DUF2442 domain-containing protein [Phycisphaerae bacterium]
MKSTRRGNAISKVEVSHISKNGVWILMDEQEHFLSFESNPWFENATVRQILDVRLHAGHHLEWPELDVDLELEAIMHPERYPLQARVTPARSQAGRAGLRNITKSGTTST